MFFWMTLYGMFSFVDTVFLSDFNNLRIMTKLQFDTEFKTTIVNLLNSGHMMKSICL